MGGFCWGSALAGSVAYILDGLPVLHRLVPVQSAKHPRFDYYFEDRYGNLHLIRAGAVARIPRQDSTFRGHPIYDNPIKPRLALGCWMVYYYRDSYNNLIRVMVSRPKSSKPFGVPRRQ